MFGTKASFLVDLFLAVQVVLLPTVIYGVRLVRLGNVRAHARVMITCFLLFLLSVIAFEIDVQFIGERVAPAFWPLGIHLCFALPALVLWVRQIASAKTVTTNPAAHRRRGKQIIALLALTIATGIWLYVATFA